MGAWQEQAGCPSDAAARPEGGPLSRLLTAARAPTQTAHCARSRFAYRSHVASQAPQGWSTDREGGSLQKPGSPPLLSRGTPSNESFSRSGDIQRASQASCKPQTLPPPPPLLRAVANPLLPSASEW